MARWPALDLETHLDHTEHDFWDRVGSAATADGRNWLSAGQPGRTSNVIDAAVLRMTELAPGLQAMTPELTFQEEQVICEWVHAANLIQRPDHELKPMKIVQAD